MRGQRLAGLRGEVGIGAGLGPPYPPTDLVKLCEAEIIRAVNNQRVGRRNVEAAFDDSGRQQNVELAVVELVHHIVERAGGHLAMRGGEFKLGQLLTQELFDLWQVSNTRRDVKALATSVMFAQQGFADRDGIERRDIGADGEAIHRRRADEGELSHPGHGELERARDRRRGHGQDVDI